MTHRHRSYILTLLTASFIIALGMSFYVLAFPMNIMSIEYPMWIHAKDQASSSQPERLSTLVIGDSRAKAAFIPDLLPSPALSLTLGGGTSIELRHLVKSFLQNNPPPRCIVLSLSAQHFSESDVFWERTVKYGFLSFSESWRLLKEESLLKGKTLRREENPYIQLVGYTVGFFPFYFAELSKSLGFLRRSPNNLVYNELQKTRGHFLFGQASKNSQPGYEAHQQDFYPSPILDQYTRELMRLLNGTSAKLTIYHVPINHQTAIKMTAAFKESFAKYMYSLMSLVPSANFTKPFPTLPETMFGDPNHLNRAGALMFSTHVAEELEDCAKR